MSQANQGFAQFFNEEGLPTILDNLDMRGIDDLKERANVWMQKQKQIQAQQMQQQQMQQQQQQEQAQQQAQSQQRQDMLQSALIQKQLQSPSDAEIAVMAIQEKAKVDDANLAIKARDSETKFIETISKIRNSHVDNELKAAELDAENTRSSVEAAIKLGNHITENIERRTNND
jgi:multidrug efflux pump subunit AcrA (membrane-fusion protein)